MNPTLPKEVKAWGEGPLRLKEISRYRDTLGQIRAADNTAGRSATRHLERCQTDSDLRYLMHAPPYGHKAFFGWYRAQGRSPHAPGVCQNCPRPRSATRHLERCQTDSDLTLWQRNLPVLITVRRVHYGKMGKTPTTISHKANTLVKDILSTTRKFSINLWVNSREDWDL